MILSIILFFPSMDLLLATVFFSDKNPSFQLINTHDKLHKKAMSVFSIKKQSRYKVITNVACKSTTTN